jgi:hypothetical protein
MMRGSFIYFCLKLDMTQVNTDLILEKIKNIEITTARIETRLERDYVTTEMLRNLKEKV